jgi:hypothetical protein
MLEWELERGRGNERHPKTELDDIVSTEVEPKVNNVSLPAVRSTNVRHIAGESVVLWVCCLRSMCVQHNGQTRYVVW